MSSPPGMCGGGKVTTLVNVGNALFGKQPKPAALRKKVGDKHEKMHLKTIMFNSANFTVEDVKKWLLKHGYTKYVIVVKHSSKYIHATVNKTDFKILRNKKINDHITMTFGK